MSYCRFSSDDFQCDVYAYESCMGGFQVHVAGSRYVFTQPLPEPVSFEREHFQQWCDRHQQVYKMVEEASLQPIGLSRDGASLIVRTPGECADLLENLRAEGYRVPQYAIDALREEQKEHPWTS
jgi:hypothetical protein